jgi:hypothetical protein
VPNVTITANLIVPDDYDLNYNGVDVADDGSTVITLDFMPGESKPIPFVISQKSGTPGDLIVTSSISDPSWTDSVSPASIPALVVGGSSQTGAHTVNAPASATGGSVIINFAINEA